MSLSEPINLCDCGECNLEAKSMEVVEDQVDEDKSQPTCVICTEFLRTSEERNNATNRALPCGHVYHEECIKEWIKINPTCPQCKRCVYSGKVVPPRIPEGWSHYASPEYDIYDGQSYQARYVSIQRTPQEQASFNRLVRSYIYT